MKRLLLAAAFACIAGAASAQPSTSFFSMPVGGLASSGGGYWPAAKGECVKPKPVKPQAKKRKR
jgi:hypothetical protein